MQFMRLKAVSRRGGDMARSLTLTKSAVWLESLFIRHAYFVHGWFKILSHLMSHNSS